METSIALDLEPTPDGGAWIVRALLKITGDLPDQAGRTPLNLSLVLDRSGSMAGEKLAHAKAAAAGLIQRLRPMDTVSVVAYDDQVRTVLPPSVGVDQGSVPARIDAICAGGTTNLSGGWLRGRELVAEGRIAGGVNRVLLLTDGLANAGITDPDLLVGLCRSALAQGITTSTIGFGEGFDEDLLGRMAEAGGGGTYYIEHADQAPAVFGEEIEGLLALSAQNVAVELRPAPSTRATVVYHQYPTSPVQGGSRYELGDLYAREPRLLLAEFILIPEREAEVAVAEVLVTAQVLTAEGRVESRLVRLPIRVSPRSGASVHPEVRKELILQQAARARAEAREAQRRGDHDQAQWALERAYEAMAPHAADEEMREEAQDLRELAERFQQGVAGELDAKYLKQRSLAQALNRKGSGAAISRSRRR